jgi:hypothetical protein
MKLSEADIEIGGMVSAPLLLSRPHQDWEEAKERDWIPEGLFSFYCSAGFFSVERAPSLLNDPERILFPYLKHVVSGIRDSLMNARLQIERIEQLREDEFSPQKERMGQPFDVHATRSMNSAFRYFTLELGGALDQLAEVVALFFVGEPGCPVLGRAFFTTLKAEAEKPPRGDPSLLTARTGQFRRLIRILRKVIVTEDPEARWLDLFYLYRNKLAHIGNLTFHSFGLPASDGNIYTFLPNHWPHLIESNISSGSGGKAAKMASEVMKGLIIEQDMIEFSSGLLNRVKSLVGEAFGILKETLELLGGSPPSAAAVSSLKSERQSVPFRYFP